jgi:hypothetical protein
VQRHALRLIPLLAGALAAAGFAPPAAAADKKNATPIMAPAPPPAMPQNVKALRGQKTEIPLRTFGRHSEPLRYVIQSPPAHGRISQPRAVDREVSMVTYEPPANFAIKSDRFLFSVKTSVGVSAPVEVNITIVDEAPILTIPNVLNFGTVLVGATAAKEFELANRGGGIAEGELQVPAPWKVEGKSRYQLAGGEWAIFKIVFAPTEGREYRGEIVFTSDRQFSTALNGTAAMPVSAEPAEVFLRHEPGLAVRTGVFEVVNRTSEARTFRLSGGPRLRVEPEISVPAGGRLAVAVNTQANDVTPLDEAVKVEADGVSLRVPVKAAAVGSILRASQERIALGSQPADRGGQIALDLENIGGMPATVVGEIGAPFVVTPATFLLPPGEKRVVAVGIQPAQPGPYRSWLKLKAAAVNLEVEVEAELASTSPSAPRSPAANARTQRTEQPQPPEPDEPDEPQQWMPDMNIAGAIRVSDIRPTSAHLEWPAEINDSTRFRIERMMFTRDPKGEYRNVWLDLPQVTISRDGPKWRASIAGLKPAQSQTLRVVNLDSEGNPVLSLFKVDFFTPEEPRRLRAPSLIEALVGALVICGGIAFWRRTRQPTAGAGGG